MGFVEQPIVNSPFAKPAVHYELDEDGQPAGNRRNGRRPSQYLVPVPAPRHRRREQLAFSLDAEGEQSCITENVLVNEIRKQVDQWRDLPASQWGVTPETQRLLLHWRRNDRERKLFFCQREAVETLIYLIEVDSKRFRRQLADANAEANPELFRIACKMATSSGKTMVMGMIIAWPAVNRARRPSSKTFSDAFLVVAPGITIRDRLRVLLPQDANNLYDQLDLVPRDFTDDVRKARIVISNFHAFKPRAKDQLSALNKQVLASRHRDPNEGLSDPGDHLALGFDEQVMGRRNIVVLNDEAHHCYRERSGGQRERVGCGGARRGQPQQGGCTSLDYRSRGLQAQARPLGGVRSANAVATVIFLKTGGATSEFLPRVYDAIVWYKEHLKYRQLFRQKEIGGVGGTAYGRLELLDGSWRTLTRSEKDDVSLIPTDAQVFRIDNLTSQSVGRDKGEGAASWFPVEFAGQTYRPSEKVRWKTNETGMARLLEADRVSATASQSFPRPECGRICVKVINHFGDEVQKVFSV